MPRITPRLASAVALTLVLTPALAHADGVLTPFAGLSFKGALSETKLTWGASLLMTGDGWLGVELDFNHTPAFYGDGLVPDSDSGAMTVTGSVVVGVPIGGEHGPGLRPYVVGGIGLLRSHVDGAVDRVTANHVALSGGAGLLIFFDDHFGVRGDLRYFRSLQDLNAGPIEIDPIDFWRATVGVSFRF